MESITYDFQPGDLFIDIGGNVGLWTVELLGLYEKIYFIEPSMDALVQAKQKIDTHCDFFGVPEMKSKVRYFKNLCSDKDGEYQSIASTCEDTGNFSIYARQLYGSQNVVLAEENIRTMTLDSLIPEVKEGSRVLVKIDTEGADLDVLIGGFEFIKKFRPILMVEMHWHMYYDQEKRDRVFDLVKSLGYKIQDWVFACYAHEPDKIWDGRHTGKELINKHFQLTMEPGPVS